MISIIGAYKYNNSGRFTAFIGYEWTSSQGGDNRHRVVIYRDGGDHARRTADRSLEVWAHPRRTGGNTIYSPRTAGAEP